MLNQEKKQNLPTAAPAGSPTPSAIACDHNALIVRLAAIALQSRDLQSFLNASAAALREATTAGLCGVLERQPGTTPLLLRAGVGWALGTVGHFCVDHGSRSLEANALHQRSPVRVDDFSGRDDVSISPLLAEHDVRSGLACQIAVDENAYGVVALLSSRPDSFSNEDEELLAAAAAILAVVVARFETTKHCALELGIANALTEADEPADAMQRCIEHLGCALGCQLGEVWWVADSRSATLEHRLTWRSAQLGEAGFRQPDHDAVPRALEIESHVSGRATWCTSDGESELFPAPLREIGSRSGLAVPITADDEVLGVVTLFSFERIHGSDGLLRCLDSVGTAIGRYIAKARTRRHVRQLAAITDSSHDAILTYDAGGRITEWLSGAEKLFGYSATEMIGSPIERIVPKSQLAQLRAVNEDIRRGEVGEPYETVRRRRDGSLVDVSVRSSPVRDWQGRVVGISSTDRDITRLKEIERNLVRAHEQKDEFLAMLSHELRNPLAAMRGASDVLRTILAREAGARVPLAVLQRQGSHMARLLDGLLDASRVVGGGIELDREVVDLAGLCRDLVSELDTGAHARVTTRLPKNPVPILGDRVRLWQILDNLVSNAIKYTNANESVSVLLTQADGEAVLEVSDTGVGISDDLLPRVFDAFSQSEQSLARSSGGLGLGLTLVRSLVEAHGGTVEAKSRGAGQGAQFLVRMPTTTAAESAAAPVTAPRETLNIVLVEDNEDSAAMLKQLLELSGHEVAIAATGTQGVELVQSRAPDVVLCDLGLPGRMSGFDVAEALRADPATSELGLVAVSGYGRPQDKAQASEAGFDRHLTKPIDFVELARTLQELGNRGRQA